MAPPPDTAFFVPDHAHRRPGLKITIFRILCPCSTLGNIIAPPTSPQEKTPLEGRDPGGRLPGEFSKIRTTEEKPGGCVVEDIGDLLPTQAPVHRHYHGAEPGGGAAETEKRQFVSRQQGDSLTGTQSRRPEGGGIFCTAVQKGGEGQTLPAPYQGFPVGINGGVPGNQIVKRKIDGTQ